MIELTVANVFGRFERIFIRGDVPLVGTDASDLPDLNVTLYAVRSWTTMSSYARWICAMSVIG